LQQTLFQVVATLNGDPDWIQTNDPQLRRLLLYSTELPDLLACKEKIFGDMMA